VLSLSENVTRPDSIFTKCNCGFTEQVLGGNSWAGLKELDYICKKHLMLEGE
jgi:hypothetical protein